MTDHSVSSDKVLDIDEISKVLAQMIASKMELDVDTIKADSNLKELGLDSLDTFDLIFNAEDYFKIKVPNDQININTLQDVTALVHRLIVAQKQ